jgi:tryptophan synthase beta subunit
MHARAHTHTHTNTHTHTHTNTHTNTHTHQIWLKREELAHTGAHKINNAIGQVFIECILVL